MPVIADMGMQDFLRKVVPFSYYNISALICQVEANNLSGPGLQARCLVRRARIYLHLKSAIAQTLQ